MIMFLAFWNLTKRQKHVSFKKDLPIEGTSRTSSRLFSTKLDAKEKFIQLTVAFEILSKVPAKVRSSRYDMESGALTKAIEVNDGVKNSNWESEINLARHITSRKKKADPNYSKVFQLLRLLKVLRNTTFQLMLDSYLGNAFLDGLGSHVLNFIN